MRKIIFSSFIIILFVFMLFRVTALQTCQLYDDFSSGSLNSLLWEERTFHSDPFTSEHFVDVGEGAYWSEPIKADT